MAEGKPTRSNKPLLRALAGDVLDRPPWWLMRQAGRYLPEYRAVRERAGDFITLCLTPDLAAEVTLQPVRRFGMDAAILFSDILLVPRALGQRLSFENDGPRLEPVTDIRQLAEMDAAMLAPVGEAARRVASALPEGTAFIGFAGAPWTVATYMVEGGSSRDFHRVKAWAYRDPAGFAALIGRISAATLDFLALQIAGGVEVVQLFDSWAGVLPAEEFTRWVIAPTQQLVAALKARFPAVPVIGFPRGAGLLYERYAAETGVDALCLDTAVPAGLAHEQLQSRLPVQGNLDPVMLTVGGAAMRRAVAQLRAVLGTGPYIFNLGHGILPETPPEHVMELGRLLRDPAAIG
ncbi:MAG TPA: uroporphyrinogen decarboxylase [Stellaceae bacterium]|nr:uroporphyrinogen decarboxylase [Stellaceae bacterium]